MAPRALFLLIAPLLFLALPAPAALLPSGAAESATSTAPTAETIDIAPAAGDDDRIATRLRDIYANVPSLSEVTVSVREGVVELGGVAPDAAALERAEAIAGAVDGVVTIENMIARDVSVELDEQIDSVQQIITDFLRFLPLIGAALVVGLIIALAGHLLASFSGLWARVAPNVFLAALIASAIRFVFVILGVVVALDMIGAAALLGAVLGGAGVIGIALGFAMRDTVENYVASLMLSLRQPFRANDRVVIDAHEGRVIRLTSRATVLMTLDGNHLRIPNSSVFKAVILNYTRNPQRRFDFMLGVDADDDALEALALGRETLAGLPFVLDDPAPAVGIDEVGDSNVVLKFFAWIDQREADFLKARSQAIAAAKQALEEAGFALPEPIYRLRFDQRTVPLPFENIGKRENAATASAAPEPALPANAPADPAPSTSQKIAGGPQDIAPDAEITRMVEEERTGPEQNEDLLDANRPVE